MDGLDLLAHGRGNFSDQNEERSTTPTTSTTYRHRQYQIRATMNNLHTTNKDCSREQFHEQHERSTTRTNKASRETSRHSQSPDPKPTANTTTINEDANRTDLFGQSPLAHNPMPQVGQECEMLDQRMSEEDAFIAFCADSSSVLEDDSNRRYYTNKLYQPLASSSAIAQQQDQQYQQMTDDEYLLYQELKFIQSTTQEFTGGAERADISKILEGDHDDELGRTNQDDPLDCLHLTNIIDSFDQFVSSPLIDTCPGQDPLANGAYSHHHQDSTSPDKPDSSMNISGPEYGNNISLNQYTIETDHHQQQQQQQHQSQMLSNVVEYAQQQVNDYYPATNTHNPYSSQTQDRPLQEHFNESCDQQQQQQQPQQQLYQAQEDNEAHFSDIGSCTRNDASPTGRSSQSDQPVVDDGQDKKKASKKKRNSHSSSGSSKQNIKKLKKRRSMGPASENKLISSPSNKLDDTRKVDSQSKQIKELTTRLTNDEDDFMVSDDNNSLRSDGSRRHPIVNHYRRRTANARERIRMREINQAFEKLKKVVPIELVQQAAIESGEASDQASSSGRRRQSPSSSQQADSVKLTKITTLRLAVSYISKLSELLSQTPESSSQPTTTTIDPSSNSRGDQNGVADSSHSKDNRVKPTRRSRVTAKKAPRGDAKEKRLTKNVGAPSPDSSLRTNEPDRAMAEKPDEINQIVKLDQAANVAKVQQQPIFITNPIFNKPMEHQAQQTAFVSIQSQQKQQYLTTYPNQQLLISQPLANSHDQRTLVTPVAVAILGIPTTNNNSTNSNSEHSQQPTIITQKNASYNLQLTQAQHQQITQTCQPQQVTLTLDDINGISVLRLANAQLSNQSVPVQFGASQQPPPPPQQQQIFTAQNGINYTFRPIQTPQQQAPTLMNMTPTTSRPANIQQAAIRICNSNQANNLISPPNSHNIISNNNINNSINTSSNNLLQLSQQGPGGHAICNTSQSGFVPTSSYNNATITTGTNSEQMGNITISSSAITQTQFENTNRIEMSQQQRQQPTNSTQQRQAHQQTNCITGQTTVLVPTSSLKQIATQSSQSIQTQPSVYNNGQQIQIVQNKQANLVYFNPVLQQPNFNQQPQFQQQMCIVAHQPNGSQQPPPQQVKLAVSQPPQQQQQQQQHTAPTNETAHTKALARERTSYVSHFTTSTEQSHDKGNSNETNINQLVASLATSIQPQNNNSNIQSRTITSTPRTTRDESQRSAQPQQPIRTYRFHNYDGNMINNHLYGGGNNQTQQNGGANKRNHSNNSKQQQQKQQQESVVSDKLTVEQQQQPVVCQRSRQNSLSSICSTTSCSSSSLNYTSSTNGSPSNHMQVVTIMVSSPTTEQRTSNRSATSSASPILSASSPMDDTSSMPQEDLAKIAV